MSGLKDVNSLLREIEAKCSDKGSTIEFYEAIALITEIVKLQQQEIDALKALSHHPLGL